MESHNYLSEAFIDTLGKMSFLDAALTLDSPETITQVGFKLTILRPFADQIYVFFPKSVVSEMVDNLFDGQDNVHNSEIILDCVAEFLNIFAGTYFQLMTPNKLFELGLPQEARMEEISKDYQSLFFKTVNDEIISVYHKLDN